MKIKIFILLLMSMMLYGQIPENIDGVSRNKIKDYIDSRTAQSVNPTNAFNTSTRVPYTEANRRLQDYLNVYTDGSGVIVGVSATPVLTGPITIVTNIVNNNIVKMEGWDAQDDGLGFFANKIFDSSPVVGDLRPFDICFATGSTNIEIAVKQDASVTGTIRFMVNDKVLGTPQVISSGVSTNYIVAGQFSGAATGLETYRNWKIQCSGTIHPWKITVMNSNQVVYPIDGFGNKRRLFTFGDSMNGNYGVSGFSSYQSNKIIGHCLGLETFPKGYGSAGFSQMGNWTNIYNQFKIEVHNRGLMRNGDICWVLGGGSDVAIGGDSSETVRTNALAFIDLVRSSYPNSQIWMCPGYNFYNSPSSWYSTYATGISNACAQRSNCYFWNTLYFSTTQTNRIVDSSDGHFNAFGNIDAAGNVLRDIYNFTVP